MNGRGSSLVLRLPSERQLQGTKVDEDVALGEVLELTGAGNMVGPAHHYLPILKEVTVPRKSPAHITGRQVTKVRGRLRAGGQHSCEVF